MRLPSIDYASGAALVTLVGGTVICHLAPSPATARRWLAAVARWLGRPLRIASRHTGRHCDKRVMDIEAQYADVMLRIRADAEQASRAIDDALAAITPRTPTQPNPMTPAACHPRQPEAAPSSPVEDDAATLPQPPNPPFPGGLGQPTLTDLFWPEQRGHPYAPANPDAPRLVLPAPAAATLGQLVTDPVTHPLMPGAARYPRPDALIDVTPRPDGTAALTVTHAGGTTELHDYRGGDWKETSDIPVVLNEPVVRRWYAAFEQRRDALAGLRAL